MLRRHRVQHGLGCGHALRHDLEQFVEGLGVLGEEVAEALHEALEVRFLTVGALLQHLVERRHHVLHAGHVLGRHVLHRTGELVHVLLHQLLTEPFGELLEALLCLRGQEVVRLEALDLACEVIGQHVEFQVPPVGGLLGEFRPSLVP